MEYDQINRSAILELATYAMCESKKTDFENLLLEKVLVKVKEKLLLDKPSNDRDQALRYIEQVELAIREDPTIGQVTVLRTSFSKERDYESRTSLGEECDYDSQTSLDEERKYESPMDAVCFSDGGTLFVQYRGTPAGGWVQNPISYGADIGEYMAPDGMSSQIQADGLDFFDGCVRDFMLNGDATGLVAGGHSQGGNVAEYVTMMSGYGALIDMCVSLDAPDHSEELYKHVKSYGEDHFTAQSSKIIAFNGNNDYVNMQGQTSFAVGEQYITTNEEWAKENGHAGLFGGHDLLYMMDRERGGLIPTAAQVEAKNQEELWGNLPIDEYAEFFPYLSTKEQIEFLSHFPATQQALLFASLSMEQRRELRARLPKDQAEQIDAEIAQRGGSMITKKLNESAQGQQIPSASAIAEGEKKPGVVIKGARMSIWEFEKWVLSQATAAAQNILIAVAARASMNQALQQIEEAKEDLLWGKLPLDEYAEFLVYLLPSELIIFLDQFPPRYQEQIFALLPEWQQTNIVNYLKTGKQQPLHSDYNAKREEALAKGSEAMEQIRIMLQAEEVRQSQNGQQGPLGLLMTEIVKSINALPKEQRDGSALSMMGVLELKLGSEDFEQLRSMGIDTEKLAALIENGIPTLAGALVENAPISMDTLLGVLLDGPAEYVVALIFGALFGPAGPLILKSPQFYSTSYKALIETIKFLINSLASTKPMSDAAKIYSGSVERLRAGAAPNAASNRGMPLTENDKANIKYMEENDRVIVDTDRLRGYAAQIDRIIGRLDECAEELRRKIKQEESKDEEEQNQESIASWRATINSLTKGFDGMRKAKAYFLEVAGDFEVAENRARSFMNQIAEK